MLLKVLRELNGSVKVVGGIALIAGAVIAHDSRYAKAGDIEELKRSQLRIERRLLDKERFELETERRRLCGARIDCSLPAYAEQRLRAVIDDIRQIDRQLLSSGGAAMAAPARP